MTSRPTKPTPTAADVVRRLPVFRQLDASQAELLKLTPAWSAWCQQNLPAALANCQLNSLVCDQAGQTLVIACSNATIASQLKHQQPRLLNSLNNSLDKEGVEIEQIVIRIQTNQQNHQYAPTSNNKIGTPKSRPVPSDNALKAINNCQKIVDNDGLAKSLERLSRTLRESDKKG